MTNISFIDFVLVWTKRTFTWTSLNLANLVFCFSIHQDTWQYFYKWRHSATTLNREFPFSCQFINIDRIVFKIFYLGPFSVETRVIFIYFFPVILSPISITFFQTFEFFSHQTEMARWLIISFSPMYLLLFIVFWFSLLSCRERSVCTLNSRCHGPHQKKVLKKLEHFSFFPH